ncbi:MAG TPA: response regulator [Devosia sp.]|jgi:DNA-binding NtrC family response regulator|uniref:response regulator n=1 Tax=Devosia sp. TaxID=1871048 RepID=UPI002F95C152
MTTKIQDRPKSFLIVDDEPLIRMELAQIVHDCGLEALEACDTAQALTLLDSRGEEIAGLITDINMPGTRSGIVLAKHVNYIWPHIRIIVVSGAKRPIPGDLPECTEFLSKPFPLPRLVATIKSLSGH